MDSKKRDRAHPGKKSKPPAPVPQGSEYTPSAPTTQDQIVPTNENDKGNG